MALETGTFTNDLVVTNPVHGDGLGQGDSHLRLIKSTLKNTFPNFTSAALNSTQAQLDAAVASVTGAAKSSYNAGTAALPGLYAVGNTNTGLYSPLANQIGLAVGGVAMVNVAVSGLAVAGAVASVGVNNTGSYTGGTGQLVPIGTMLMSFDDALPTEGGYCWANGGTLSRAANPTLWARWGTRFGVGDGSTTFNVPNMCEVGPVGQRSMGGAASRGLLSTGSWNAPFGAGTATLVTGNLPPYTPSGSVATTVTPSQPVIQIAGGNSISPPGTIQFASTNNSTTTFPAVSTFTGAVQGGVSTPVSIVQPSVVMNFIIRIG